MRFKAWLREYLRDVGAGKVTLNTEDDEIIGVYLALIRHGYSKDQACEIMDLYMTEESEESRCEA